MNKSLCLHVYFIISVNFSEFFYGYRPGMANLFKWWVKFKVVDRKKKNAGHRCNNINEGFESKFCPNLCKWQKKKIFTSEIPSFPSLMPQYGKISFFSLRYFSLPFFRKIFLTTSGSLTCASGLLSDPRVSGSPSLL